MTAYPDPIDFADLSIGSNLAGMSMRPNGSEHF